MLISKLLSRKKRFTTAVGDIIDDLISSTFTYPERMSTLGPVRIKEDEAMRPDLLANRIYADNTLWDILLKFNGISNPFSLLPDEILFAPQMQIIMKSATNPKTVPEKGMEIDANANEKKLVKPRNNTDVKRLDALRKKVKELVPPNVNKTGVKNIVTRDGLVVLGGSMSQSSEANKSGSLSRSRVITNLNNTTNL
jgi:hypothetical protein